MQQAIALEKESFFEVAEETLPNAAELESVERHQMMHSLVQIQAAPASSSSLEAKLRVKERELARSRFALDLFDSQIKAKRKEIEEQFLKDTTNLRNLLCAEAEKENKLKTEIEQIAASLYFELKREGRGRKTLTDAVQIKETSYVDFSVDAAKEYVIEHGLTQFLKLDVKEFEKAAKVLNLDFVYNGTSHKVCFSTDMAKALALNKEELEEELYQQQMKETLSAIFNNVAKKFDQAEPIEATIEATQNQAVPPLTAVM